MAFLVGPRQVGKTTASLKSLAGCAYLNWDNQEHRKIILEGPLAVINYSGGERLSKKKISIIFDEIHKYPKWQNFLKGFFDTYNDVVHICVTGSARLNVYKYGGDSMMGRYFLYRMHPLSVREALSPSPKEISTPMEMEDAAFKNLLMYGGFPEPFLRCDKRFYNKWKRLRLEQVFNDDLRDLSRISDIARIKVLAEKLAIASGASLNYSNLANDIQVSVDTVRRWIEILESVYYCFRIRPFSGKLSRSLLKEPKAYLWDWSLLSDTGKRNENFVACHLAKAIHYYNDMGFGDYQLYYLKDKSKREVDFLVTKNSKPWFLAEVKTGDQPLSPALKYFTEATQAPHSFQVTFNLPYVNRDCFKTMGPLKVPAKTFLSQLV